MNNTEVVKNTKAVRKTGKNKNVIAKFFERNRNSNGYLLKKTVGTWVYSIVRAFLLFGLCFLIIQPLLGKVSVSFMTEGDLYDPTVISIPRNFTLTNYELVNGLINYPISLLKTFIMALVVAVFQVMACTVVGYGFARFKFPLKNFLFLCVMLVIVIPPQTIMSSLYLHFRFFDVFGIITLINGSPINLIGSEIPYLLMSLTCMGLKSGLYIFMLRQFFRGLPKEIEEAAYVDGCGRFRTFFQIMLPDAKAMITSCFLFAFVWQWTDSFYSSLFLRHLGLLPNNLTAIPERINNYWIQLFGQGARASSGVQQQMIATGMFMFILPLIVLYLIAQKGFVESLSQSGIKM